MPYAQIGGKRLHYTDYPASSASSPTLIFVHGLGSTSSYYHPIIPTHLLPKYRCITFDNYGAGRSPFTSDTRSTTSIESIGQDVIGLLDHLNVERAVVVGYSMGGMVPTLLASSKDEKVKNRVIAGVCVGPVHPGNPAAKKIFEDRIALVEKEGMQPLSLSIPTSATGPKSTPLHHAFIREMLLAQPADGYIANCRAIVSASAPDYKSVRCPVLIIAGDADKSAPIEGCRFIHENLGTESGNKRIEILEGVGHWLCVESSEEVGKLVRSFVDGLEFSV